MSCITVANRLLVVALAACMGGCANHIKVDSHTDTEVERVKISQSVDIQTDAGSLVTTPLVRVLVEDSQSVKVKTYEAKSDYDVETPYQGVRELYEVPMGLVLLPVAIVVNVLDFATLGLLPNKFTDTLLDWSFAGMNPFLNIESESRSTRTLVKSDKKIIDEKEEFLKKPLANKPLQVSAGGANINFTLDDHGKAEVSLVRLSALTTDVDKVTLNVVADAGAATKDIDVSRQLRAQLQQASSLTSKYASLAESGASPETVSKLDLVVFAADLVALSKLGFESESLRIEKNTLALLSEEQKLAFKSAMDKSMGL